ncbi:MAG TPA: hypothetical protein VI873_03365, partial [Candidatus Peribacteraceae bacterium]|nr:hypothetical protein [Candidatus Peribacteraceae bacterium]
KKGNEIYAMFISKNLSPEGGVKFLTESTSPFQLGLMERPAGHQVKPHQHLPQSFDVQRLSEFLYIEHGKIKVTVFDEEWNVLAEQELGGGDYLLFLRGGHGIEVLEPVRMIEVKQGPFPGDKQSKTFRA